MTQTLGAAVRPLKVYPLAIFTLTGITLLWTYWTTLGEMVQRWAHDPQYSHGWMVPAFAALLLYLRRRLIPGEEPRPSWWGLALISAALVMRLAGTFFHYAWLDPLSLLPCLAGVFVLAGGWRYLRWSWPAVAFLFFMVPLPHRLAIALAGPLQRVATEASTFLLQVLGRPAIAEGTVILLNDVELGVVEACSGLRMLVVFFALSTAVAMLMRKPLGERVVVALSALPIALVSNILRITVTGLLHDTAGREVADAVFHDLAGWLMMPLALAFLGLELKLLKHLLIEPDRKPVATPPRPELPLPRATLPPLAARRSRRQAQAQRQPAPFAGRSLTKR